MKALATILLLCLVPTHTARAAAGEAPTTLGFSHVTVDATGKPPALDSVLWRRRLLESGHPSYDIPTTGAVVGDSFYYTANSQLDRLADDGTIARRESLRDVVVLGLKIP